MPSDDPSAPPAYSFTFFHIGPVLRVCVFVLLAGVSIFLAAMGAWMTEDSFLSCAREGNAGRCSVRSVYALNIASVEPLPLVTGAHTERRLSHDKYGDHPYDVLILEVASGAPLEFPGVGDVGARSEAVAKGVSAFLAGEGGVEERWHLRESSTPAAAFMFALSAALFVFAFIAFHRTRMELDPMTKVLTVQRGRWPLPAKSISVPLADVEGFEMTQQRSKNGIYYRASLSVRGQKACPLGITGQVEAGVQARIDAIEERLALWRQM